MKNINELPIENEKSEDYMQEFDQLKTLGDKLYDAGKKVSFQPWGRYEGERQVGTVRLWEEDPNLIHIIFKGSKAGVSYPDEERITRENFNQRKDIWQIRKVE